MKDNTLRSKFKVFCISITIIFLSITSIFQFITIRNDKNFFYPINDRDIWISAAKKIALPILSSMATGNLQNHLSKVRVKRSQTASFEAIARTLDGIAPWLEIPSDETSESKIRDNLLDLAHRALEQGVDFTSQDSVLNLHGNQPLVEYAYLCQAFLRSPTRLWGGLKDDIKKKWIDQMKKSRSIKPIQNNWLLFASEVEAFLLNETNECDEKRLNKGPDTFMDGWFVGEGMYKDGPGFHLDYYGSYVIHPMLFDILSVIANKRKSENALKKLETEKKRSILYARWLERLISPEGYYPVFGRSICCRMGVFHNLADVARRKLKIPNVHPAQIRSALTAVIKKQVVDQNFTPEGFLKLGFNGDQSDVCEGYFNQGSLYHSALIFLPLGLQKDDQFWASPAQSWTSKLAWEGQKFINDH
ncbi:hypothetical protein M9Y10_003782 [Tritrichomonas musculus]|uniref:DUF2264 domain-containing protein n=1 Tax=Tritrichomonas musculus TaxID=1915356 RepID=A0ABR2JQ86_9EUKA